MKDENNPQDEGNQEIKTPEQEKRLYFFKIHFKNIYKISQHLKIYEISVCCKTTNFRNQYFLSFRKGFS